MSGAQVLTKYSLRAKSICSQWSSPLYLIKAVGSGKKKNVVLNNGILFCPQLVGAKLEITQHVLIYNTILWGGEEEEDSTSALY